MRKTPIVGRLIRLIVVFLVVIGVGVFGKERGEGLAMAVLAQFVDLALVILEPGQGPAASAAQLANFLPGLAELLGQFPISGRSAADGDFAIEVGVDNRVHLGQGLLDELLPFFGAETAGS